MSANVREFKAKIDGQMVVKVQPDQPFTLSWEYEKTENIEWVALSGSHGIIMSTVYPLGAKSENHPVQFEMTNGIQDVCTFLLTTKMQDERAQTRSYVVFVNQPDRTFTKLKIKNTLALTKP
ncbi:hypothetical protein ACIQWR_41240 [Streptomyces sp. NPDC098789]|uniref:hypothetical protein n=1 Tax=Streptomyces sp. NPDC098789 TaxID=3366098 RepID=UPI00380114B8